MLHFRCAVMAVALLAAPLLRADDPVKKPVVVKMAGAIEKPAEWTAADIAKDFAADVKEVGYTLKGQAAKARAVPLAKLVAAAKPKIDPKQKGHILAFCVVVRGTDGYTTNFSMGELLPEYAGAEIYVALDRDGAPLSERDRPASLLVLGDKKPSRWVQGIASITVVDVLTMLPK
jgi:hypothetical protein